jgi:HD-GYP domain-containing protein (c-di-GMP phosphodiesterase class II)
VGRALAEIRGQAGCHFDPDLVPVFVAMVEAE